MTGGGLADFADQARSYLYSQLGDCFTNTSRAAGRCRVCTSPTGDDRLETCGPCSRQRAEFGDGLADLVVPLAYVRGWMTPQHQSEHMVRRYKASVQPSQRFAELLQFMILAATAIHGPCIATASGTWWDVMTFVPSATRRGADHPVVGLARHVYEHGRRVERVLLTPTEHIASTDRHPRRDVFTLSPTSAGTIRGRHVLVVDDTFVPGAKSQSAALALKAAGAGRVTVLCVARWLSYRWDEHRCVIDGRLLPYDALACPVGTVRCQAQR